MQAPTTDNRYEGPFGSGLGSGNSDVCRPSPYDLPAFEGRHNTEENGQRYSDYIGGNGHRYSGISTVNGPHYSYDLDGNEHRDLDFRGGNGNHGQPPSHDYHHESKYRLRSTSPLLNIHMDTAGVDLVMDPGMNITNRCHQDQM